jgi:4-amino-4-deoxy-L-arabinose transferase-like glycosyltransferase
MWGGWLVVTGLVFSFMQGIFHAYYNVALAPAIGAVVGIGAVTLWRQRSNVVIAATTVVTAWWSWTLLGRSTDWHPWIRVVVLVLGLGAAGLLLLAARLPRMTARVAVVAALAAALLGPLGYALNTAASAHTGSIVTAGPTVAGASFGPGGGGRLGGGGGPGGARGGGFDGGGFNGGGPGGMFGGGTNGGTTNGAGTGGLLNAQTPGAELLSMLKDNADSYTWVAAAVGSNNAAGLQLASEEPVMAIGGFNGSDPSPTLAEFQRYVADGKIHYFIGGTLGQSNGGSNSSQQIAAWVAANFTATTVGNTTVYDLTTG